ncbi:MAG: Glu/Leu/Phe/Val dehydrogenase [Pseudobdellovibrionaceae bacterium]
MLKDNSPFAVELTELHSRFEAMRPEQEITISDAAMGVEGYIIVWNTGIAKDGPMPRAAKGGTRIHANLTKDEVAMLAKKMALKNAAAGLPLGGAKSGLRADPSAPDFKDTYQSFCKLSKPYLYEFGGDYGGFGFDIGARPEHALWACEAIGSTRSFTGKPLEMGGTDYDREGIAGLGVAVAARTALEETGKSARGANFIVQGLGAMGAAVVRYFSTYGGILAGISDPRVGGSWVFEAPPPESLYEAIRDRKDAELIAILGHCGRFLSTDNNAVLTLDCDVLFPCAVQDVITPANAVEINAKLVCEGANGPVTEESYAILEKRGITVIPDFIANSGGIIAAFVEMTSSSENKCLEAKTLTEQKIAENVRLVLACAAKHGVSSRQAALYITYKRIFQ